MNQQEQLKRKFCGLANFKTISTITNIAPNKQWKRSDISREKDQNKPIDRQSKLISHHQDENNKANSKALNFRNLKETIPKKQAITLTKNTVFTTKPSAEYFPKSTRHQPEPHGISINVNIQNMIPKQTQATEQLAISDRSIILEDKKSRKAPIGNNIPQKFDEFQCTEELVFKRTPIEKKSKFGDKTIQKIPLIDRNKLIKTDVHQKPKQKILDIKETLKKFEAEMETINSAAQSQTINYLDLRQQSYLIQPNYMDKCQKNLTWKMRATLLEWIMHVCYQFAMKRQTFYLSMNLVDLFLSRQFHLPKSEFQLVGAAAMFIASKIQQFQPKSSEQFAIATKTYKGIEVKEMEKKICKILKYTLNPPTLSTWANRFMLQWDTYLEQNPYARNHQIFMRHPHKFFKKWDDESYKLYRTVMQLLDFASLDIQSVQYQPKLVVCAFMYLILGKQMGIFKLKQITNEFPRSSLYLLDDSQFNDLFMNYLQTSFNIMLIDLLPTVQYCATFFILPFNYEDPIISNNEDELSNVEFEDFCSYQTYNPNMKTALSKRFRGIYE